MILCSLESYLSNAEKCFHFAMDGAWSQHAHYPKYSLSHCLRSRSFWMTLVGKENPLYEQACARADVVSDKSEMDVFLPDVLALKTSEYERSKDIPRNPDDHSFRYQLKDEKQCYIHIHNARQPKSFLDETADTIGDFRYIMDLSERENGCTELFTATWLNSCPRFLRYFPQEWIDNMTYSDEEELFPTGGYQGQFYNRTGMLNEKTAAYFVENGKLMYRRNASYCSFAALRAHLDKMEAEL